MNVAFLLKEYFQGAEDVSIDVIAKQTMHDVYYQVCSSIEKYHIKWGNIYEVMSLRLDQILADPFILSSNRPAAVITHFDEGKEILRILVADEGIGIKQSFARRLGYMPEGKRAIESSINSNGIGVYTRSGIFNAIGINLTIHSDNHKLISKNGSAEIIETDFWQGTIVYMEIETSRNISLDLLNDLTARLEIYDEDDTEHNKPVIFEFSSYGTDFTTRDMGAIFREQIRPILEDTEDVVLDFTGVSVSDSFINECIFKLLSDKTLPKKEQPVVIKGLSETIDLSCLDTLQRRCKIIP